MFDGPQVKENGLQDAVMTLDELATGDDTKLAGAARDVDCLVIA